MTSTSLRMALDRIEPSVDAFGHRTYPCQGVLSSGKRIPRLCVIDTQSPLYLATITIRDLASVEECPHRLPSRLAKKAYAAGETGMGYYAFRLVLSDGRQLDYVITKSVVDFPDLPVGVRAGDVVDLANYGHNERVPVNYLGSAKFCWAETSSIDKLPDPEEFQRRLKAEGRYIEMPGIEGQE